MEKEDWGNIYLAGLFGSLAGYTNVLAIQSLGVTVSHVTGTISKVGIRLLDLETHLVFVGMGLWFFYVFGAAAGKYLKDKVGTAIPLLLNGVILLALGILVSNETVDGAPLLAGCFGFFAAFGMGMQNVITSGTVMNKTTHLTGASTEFGVAIAEKNWQKFHHMGIIILGFLLGAFAALLADFLIGIKGFVIPGLATIAIVAYHMDYDIFLHLGRKEGSQLYGILPYESVFED